MTTATLNETDTCPTCGRSSDNGPCLCPEEASSPTAADWDAAAEYEPTADDWADYGEWLASLPEQLPVPEDFPDVTPGRAAEILELCNGLPF